MKRNLVSSVHPKHLILYHLIFVAKYRRKIFSDIQFGEGIKSELIKISEKYDFSIDTIDLDYSKPDHINILVKSTPNLNPVQIVKVLKQESNTWAWENYSNWLRKFYYKSKHVFTRGYFCSSVGNVSAQQVEEYLEKQGRNYSSV